MGIIGDSGPTSSSLLCLSACGMAERAAAMALNVLLDPGIPSLPIEKPASAGQALRLACSSTISQKHPLAWEIKLC